MVGIIRFAGQKISWGTVVGVDAEVLLDEIPRNASDCAHLLSHWLSAASVHSSSFAPSH